VFSVRSFLIHSHFYFIFVPLLLVPFSSQAGTIRIHSSVTTGETFLAISVQTEGQEDIQNVTAHITLGDSTFQTPMRPSLSPGDKLRARWIGCIPSNTGRYMARTRIQYSDLNLYPHSAVMLHPLTIGSPPPSYIVIRAKNLSIWESALFQGTVFNRSPAPRKVTLDFFVPNEFSAEPPSLSLDVPPQTGRAFETVIKNLGALSGGQFPIYVIASDSENGVALQSASRAMLGVNRVKRWQNPWFLGLGGIIVLLGMWFIVKPKEKRRAES